LMNSMVLMMSMSLMNPMEVSNMVAVKHIALVALLLVGLMVSGCVNQDDAQAVDEGDTGQEMINEGTDVADELLAEEGAGLTDSEVSDLEDDLAELEAMLDDMNMDENFTFEDV
ncbi:MAG: hypothetical protein U9N13_04635, partial [Euryarchaeota archaeon]|nr:hypothetical protein [Euryarchaeota archaeon]